MNASHESANSSNKFFFSSSETNTDDPPADKPKCMPRVSLTASPEGVAQSGADR